MKGKLVVVLLALTGCVTPYQPAGSTGGYAEQRLARGVFEVEAAGNGFTSVDVLIGYLVRRGKELCRADGFPRVLLQHFDDQVDRQTTPAEWRTETTYEEGRTVTRTYQQPGVTTEKHRLTAQAICLSEAEYQEQRAALEAQSSRERLLSGAGASDP